MSEFSPEVAKSLQASEESWHHMHLEFGLLDAAEFARAASLDQDDFEHIFRLQLDGDIIGVFRDGRLRFPGFQIDRHSPTVLPVIPDLVAIARAAKWRIEHLALWMISPNGYLSGARPVDRLSEPESVLEAARQDFAERF